MNLFQRASEKSKLKKEAVQKARENFLSWQDISKSPGWRTYEQVIEKKIENIKERLTTDTSLTGEDLKKLQLAIQVWREVQRIPKTLEENAKKGKA